MNLVDHFACARLARTLRDYQPQRATLKSVQMWMEQFRPEERKAARVLLRHLRYVREKEFIRTMVELNRKLLARLERAGVPPNKVIYVSVHDAGSSSAGLLNRLRDAARLQSLGCTLVDSNNHLGLHQATQAIGEGAIVYVDDFAGTGNQFCDSYDVFSNTIVGNFSQFLLLHTVCEEAVSTLAKRSGVEPMAEHIHSRAERPLHENSSILPDDVRDALRAKSLAINKSVGLGYRRLATMVVFSHNAPNTVPLLLRGNINQTLFRGIVPRTTDFQAA